MKRKLAIDIREYWNINGCRQFVAIKGTNRDNPILLYLHGGPGDAALPLVEKFNMDLTDIFNVVIWEQRGAGKSYYPFGKDENVGIDTFVEDAKAIVEKSLALFDQKKLYVVGHSWGSVIGLKFIPKYPELVNAYIGCGQVVDMKEGCRRAYEFAKTHATDVELKRLNQINLDYNGHGWMKDLLYVTGLVVKYGGSLFGKSNYNTLTWPFFTSRHYSLSDLWKRVRGSKQSICRLWPELMTVDFTDINSFEVPVVFTEGRHDRHVSSDLAAQYISTIKTPKHLIWFENSAHFPQWEEPERFMEVMKTIRETW